MIGRLVSASVSELLAEGVHIVGLGHIDRMAINELFDAINVVQVYFKKSNFILFCLLYIFKD